MPEPGKAMTPLGSRLSRSSLRRKGAGLAVRAPVGTADHLVDASGFRPARGDLLDAGTATMEQHHVAVLRARHVERAPDRVGIGDGLAAGDGDEGALGQVRPRLEVLACAAEVACVDGGGGELSGPGSCASRASGARYRRSRRGRRRRRGRGASRRPSRLSPRFCARSVIVCNSHAFTSDPSCAFSRSRISGVMRSTARSSLCTWLCSMLVKPHMSGSRSSAIWVAVDGDAVDDDADGFVQRIDGVVFVPDDPAVELAALGRCAVEGHALANGCSRRS